MDRKNFIKHDEDFCCEHCGEQVVGSGYTNHCPQCLWSKHVDNIPGDRANSCHGLMEPVKLELKQGLPDRIVHRCQVCGKVIHNKVADNDSPTSLRELSIE